jgi:hypothetical protein
MIEIAKIYYQKNFTIYGLDSEMSLQVDPDMSVFICSFPGEEGQNREQVCTDIFKQQNFVNGDPDPDHRARYDKAKHTSMSVGDYVIFEDGEIWICASCGWKVFQGSSIA